MKAKSPSDSTLQALWRKVVHAEWGNRCALTEDLPCDAILECHHIIKSSRPHLKHVPSNGILLCRFHHGRADTMLGRKQISDIVGPDKMEWLSDMERKLFKDVLKFKGQTRAEFFQAQKEYLQGLLERSEE